MGLWMSERVHAWCLQFGPHVPGWGQGARGLTCPRGCQHLLVYPQDTCVALQALAEYAILSHAGSVNLTISLASTNLDYQETFELHRANQKVLQTAAVCIPGPDVGGPTPLPAHCGVSAEGITVSSLLQIPSLPTGLFMSARGEGCCLMQVSLWGHRVLVGASGTWGLQAQTAPPAMQLWLYLLLGVPPSPTKIHLTGT